MFEVGQDPAIGTRVVLVKDVENYPVIYAKAGLTGKVASINNMDDFNARWMIKLDLYHPELKDWNNELEITNEHLGDDDRIAYHPRNMVEALPPMTQERLFEALTADDATLDSASTAYQAYLDAEGLPQMSADELLHEDLTEAQRHTVSQFVRWWENADK